MVRASDLQPRVPAAPLHVTTLLFTHMCFCSPIGTGASWELNRHSTRHTSPVSADLQLRLRATETEISAALWALVAREWISFGFSFSQCSTMHTHIQQYRLQCAPRDRRNRVFVVELIYYTVVGYSDPVRWLLLPSLFCDLIRNIIISSMLSSQLLLFSSLSAAFVIVQTSHPLPIHR